MTALKDRPAIQRVGALAVPTPIHRQTAPFGLAKGTGLGDAAPAVIAIQAIGMKIAQEPLRAALGIQKRGNRKVHTPSIARLSHFFLT